MTSGGVSGGMELFSTISMNFYILRENESAVKPSGYSWNHVRSIKSYRIF
jgi:hypothetical protein